MSSVVGLSAGRAVHVVGVTAVTEQRTGVHSRICSRNKPDSSSLRLLRLLLLLHDRKRFLLIFSVLLFIFLSSFC